VNNLPKVVVQQRHGRASNPRLLVLDSGVARNLIWGVYVLTSHCNFKTCVNVPHVNKTVTDFGGVYIPIYPRPYAPAPRSQVRRPTIAPPLNSAQKKKCSTSKNKLNSQRNSLIFGKQFYKQLQVLLQLCFLWYQLNYVMPSKEFQTRYTACQSKQSNIKIIKKLQIGQQFTQH